MKNEKIISLNLILSIFGIYISFFSFGWVPYFYPTFFFFDIIKSGILVSTALGIPLILSLFIISKFFNSLKKIFISLFVALLSTIVFHYLIRFSDINYFHFMSSIFDYKNTSFKIILGILPFIILFLFSIFLKKEKIFNLNRFILILLIILNIFSLYRNYEIFVNDDIDYRISDYENFQVNLDGTKKNQKVFILLFDEFDQFIFNKNYEKFTNIKKFYETSYVNKNLYSPAKFTMDSIPAILTGNSTKRTIIKNGNLYFQNLKNEQIQFNHENSLFNIDNISYSIFGFYHPYCKILKAQTCYDKYGFKKSKINFKTSLDYFSRTLFIDRLINVKPILDRFFKDDQDLSKQDKSLEFDHLFSKFMMENSLNFLKSNNDIIYVHYPYPHPPFKKNIIKLEKKNETLSNYEKNLFLVDHTFSLIEKFLNDYEESLLIVLSDHWHKDVSLNKALPTVFFSKIIGDNNYIEDNRENNTSNVKGLIKMFFEDKINSNLDINNYFKTKLNHKSYVR